MILWLLIWIPGIWCTNVTKNYRLPTTIKPEHYDLEINTYLYKNDFSFSGRVKITIKCLEETNKIILHSKNLTIDKNKLLLQDRFDNKSYKAASVTFDEEKDFLIIALENNLTVNKTYKLLIDFRGILDDNLYGYYRSSYYNSLTNKTEWMTVTQFEATSARKAFPCFDEPGMKAIFKISLGRPSEYNSISNMPLIKSESLTNHPGMVLDQFAESPPMSTYLVAFIISKFDYKQSDPTPNNVTFRTYARKDAIDQVNFSKEVGPKVLSFFENYFNVKFVLPKTDMIAIPDFSAGAMENWGLVTYRETLLLFSNKTNSEVSKYSIASVICHELAHQWFGNLVTMKWWTDLWLNEGFATQMASIATNALFPEWNTLDFDTVTNVLQVFSLDSLKTSHPISVFVRDPKEISEIFDIISYKKGSFLLHMLINFLGEESFKKGVSHYLKKHSFENAQQDDLWEALTVQAHQDGALYQQLSVKEVMDTWTLQTGYPVLTVTRNYACNTTVIMQERFLSNSFNQTTTEKPCWWVPITYMTAATTLKDRKPKHWLSCPCGVEVIHDLPGKDAWILFNVNMSALYRVNYDELNWKLLTQTLQSEQFDTIPVLNRVQLIDDSGALAWTGRLSYEVHFNILNYLVREKNYLPWKAAISNLDVLEKLFRRTSHFGVLKIFIKNLVQSIYGTMGGYKARKISNALDDLRFQSTITMWGCNYKVESCVSEAQDLFKKWEANPINNVIPKDLRSINYCVTIKNGGEPEWNFLWNQYHSKLTTPAEKQTILIALGCSRDIWILVRYLEWSINSSSGIRKQDIGTIFSTIANNEVGYYVLKNFLYQRLSEIYEYLGSDGSKRISRAFNSIATQIIDSSELNEFKQFTKQNEKILKDSAQTIRQAIETAEIQVEWFKRNNATIVETLNALNKQYN